MNALELMVAASAAVMMMFAAEAGNGGADAPGYFAAPDPATVCPAYVADNGTARDWYDTWADANGITDRKDEAQANKDAYLLDCAPTAEAVAAAKAAFKITSFEQDANGNWVVMEN